ncbi:MAG: hypothetical protein AAB402_04705 [Patescibacteria group bacterium]
MLAKNVSKMRIVKRSPGPDSLTIQEVEVGDSSQLRKAVALLIPGERTDYYVRSPYAPTYYVQLFDKHGIMLTEQRVVGGKIVVDESGSYLLQSEGVTSLLDKLLDLSVGRRKRQKLADLRRRFSSQSAH